MTVNHPSLAGPRWHYSMHRFDNLVYGMVAVDNVWEHLGRERQRDLLELLLPDVSDIFGCWAELTEPLQQFDRIDGREAVSIMQERGYRNPNPVDALGRMQDELRAEIATVISRHRRGTAIPAGLRAVTTGDPA